MRNVGQRRARTKAWNEGEMYDRQGYWLLATKKRAFSSPYFHLEDDLEKAPHKHLEQLSLACSEKRVSKYLHHIQS